jgi:hypothetical protein
MWLLSASSWSKPENEKRWSSGEGINLHFAKINVQPVNRFLLRCRKERVSLEVNGLMAIKEARLPVSNADVTDGLLGFADAHWRTGNTTSLRTIEVRRLKPSAQK